MQPDWRYLLATYVDGPYATSAVEVVLYPTGCSFYRPFSYRRQYAGNSISATPSNAKTLPSGFIGVRFRDKQAKGTRGLFVPLRRIHEIQIRDLDSFHVHFQLGEFIQHAEPRRFLTFDLAQKLRDEFAANNDIMLAALPAQFADELGRLPVLDTPPGDLWDRFVDDPEFAHEARARLLNTTLLQLLRVRQRGSPRSLRPTKLEVLGSGVHERYGFQLHAGEVYNLDFVHRTLVAPGSTPKLRSITFKCLGPPDRFRLSRPRIPQTGNYREELVWVSPLATEPAPVTLEWEPVDDSPGAPKPKQVEMAIPLRVLVAVSGLPWYRFRRAQLTVAVFFTLSAAAALAAALKTAGGASQNWPVVFIGIAAAFAPIGVTALMTWWDAWERLK